MTIPFEGILKAALRKLTPYRQTKLKNEYRSAMDIVLLSMIDKKYVMIMGELGYLKLSQPLIGHLERILFLYTFTGVLDKRKIIDHSLFASVLHDTGLVNEGLDRFEEKDWYFGVKEKMKYNSITCVVLAHRGSFFNGEMILSTVQGSSIDKLYKVLGE